MSGRSMWWGLIALVALKCGLDSFKNRELDKSPKAKIEIKLLRNISIQKYNNIHKVVYKCTDSNESKFN